MAAGERFARSRLMLRQSFVAVLVLAIGFLMAFGLERFAPGDSMAIMLSATILCSLWSDARIAVVAAVLASLGQDYYFHEPVGTFGIHDREDLIRTFVFLGMALFFSWVGQRLRQALREALRAGAEAREEGRAREDLLGVVSHDLRNPLHSIGLGVALLRKRGVSRGAEDVLDSLSRTTSRMDRMINDLLDLEKIRSGHLKLEERVEPASAILDEARELLLPLALEKRQNLEFRQPDQELLVSCDRDRLLQVFSNIVGNAIKFTPEGGAIAVSCRQGAGASVVFEVSDSGPGIPERELPHVFDRYWQARKTARRGTGLGLSIAKGIIEAHRGAISVSSRIGQGTTIDFTLPEARHDGQALPGLVTRARPAERRALNASRYPYPGEL